MISGPLTATRPIAPAESAEGPAIPAGERIQCTKATRFDGARTSLAMTQNTQQEFHVTRGTGNVFADLGFANAGERQAKLRLIHIVNRFLEARNLTPAVAAQTLSLTPSRLSALRRYKLAEFSIEALFDLLTALDLMSTS